MRGPGLAGDEALPDAQRETQLARAWESLPLILLSLLRPQLVDAYQYDSGNKLDSTSFRRAAAVMIRAVGKPASTLSIALFGLLETSLPTLYVPEVSLAGRLGPSSCARSTSCGGEKKKTGFRPEDNGERKKKKERKKERKKCLIKPARQMHQVHNNNNNY